MQGTGGELTSDDVEILAAAIHETWRVLSRAEGWSMQLHLDKPYSDLVESDKEDNRAAAHCILKVLALVGLGLRRDRDRTPRTAADSEVNAQLDQNMERLAEAEHDGWMAQRCRNGWRWAETRDDVRKLHSAMRPYTQLAEQEKGKDRNNIRHYPDFAARAGYRILPIGQ